MSDDGGDRQAILAELREMNRWLRVLAVPVLKERLDRCLVSEQDRRIYQNSTGGSSRDVAKAAKVGSHSTVVGAWARWADAGVVVASREAGRFERLIDLREIGIEVNA